MCGWVGGTHPGIFGGIRVLKERPYFRLPGFPPPCLARVLLHAQSFQVPVRAAQRRVVVRRVRLRVLEAVQRLLRVPVLPVVHPAARLHVRLVDAPEGELLLEQRSAHIVGTVQLPGAVVVEDEGEHRGVAVEEELVEFGVVVEVAERVRLGEPRQAGAGQRLQGAPVGLMPHPAAVYHDLLAFRRTSHVCAVTCFVGRLVPTLAPFKRGYTHRTEHRGPGGGGRG